MNVVPICLGQGLTAKNDSEQLEEDFRLKHALRSLRLDIPGLSVKDTDFVVIQSFVAEFIIRNQAETKIVQSVQEIIKFSLREGLSRDIIPSPQCQKLIKTNDSLRSFQYIIQRLLKSLHTLLLSLDILFEHRADKQTHKDHRTDHKEPARGRKQYGN